MMLRLQHCESGFLRLTTPDHKSVAAFSTIDGKLGVLR